MRFRHRLMNAARVPPSDTTMWLPRVMQRTAPDGAVSHHLVCSPLDRQAVMEQAERAYELTHPEPARELVQQYFEIVDANADVKAGLADERA